MSKLAAQGSSQNRPFKPRIYLGKRRGQLDSTVIQIDINIGIDQTVVTGECHKEVEVSMDKITEECHSIIKIVEMILEREVLEEYKIIEVRIFRSGYRGTFRNDDFARGRSRS